MIYAGPFWRKGGKLTLHFHFHNNKKLFTNCEKHYNESASENIFSVALAYNGISIVIFFKAPALECIIYDN